MLEEFHRDRGGQHRLVLRSLYMGHFNDAIRARRKSFFPLHRYEQQSDLTLYDILELVMFFVAQKVAMGITTTLTRKLRNSIQCPALSFLHRVRCRVLTTTLFKLIKLGSPVEEGAYSRGRMLNED